RPGDQGRDQEAGGSPPDLRGGEGGRPGRGASGPGAAEHLHPVRRQYLPGQDVSITISYVNLLKYDEGQYEFSFPMVVGPRYTAAGGYAGPGQRGAPGAARPPDGAPATAPVLTDPEKITPPITPQGTRAGHDISLSVDLDAG